MVSKSNKFRIICNLIVQTSAPHSPNSRLGLFCLDDTFLSTRSERLPPRDLSIYLSSMQTVSSNLSDGRSFDLHISIRKLYGVSLFSHGQPVYMHLFNFMYISLVDYSSWLYRTLHISFSIIVFKIHVRSFLSHNALM